MKKRIKVIFLAFFISCSHGCLAKKHIIGAWAAGFGNVFLGALQHLSWCEENGYKPVVYWDNAFPYYQSGGYNGSENAWEYYFEQTSNKCYKSGDFIDRRFTPDRYRFASHQRFNRSLRRAAKKIIDKYVKIVLPIQKKIDEFYDKNMRDKKTIGIHLRGTDKYTEVAPIDPKLIFNEANKQADLIGQCQFLVATDEYRLLELAKKELNRPVIFYDCRRSVDGKQLWYSGTFYGTHRWSRDASLGEDFLIEFVLLSKCFIFVHTECNGAALPFYFNPDLFGVFLNSKGRVFYF